MKEVNLKSACNSNCGCSTASYEPVCGSNNIQYFSSCYAGCSGGANAENVSMLIQCKF